MARINCRISSATFGLPPRPRDFFSLTVDTRPKSAVALSTIGQ